MDAYYIAVFSTSRHTPQPQKKMKIPCVVPYVYLINLSFCLSVCATSCYGERIALTFSVQYMENLSI